MRFTRIYKSLKNDFKKLPRRTAELADASLNVVLQKLIDIMPIFLKYGIVEPSEAKITVKPRLSPRFIAKSHGNRYLCGSKQVSRSTTGILFQFKVWTLLACGVKIGRSMPYDRIHISKSRRLAY